MGKMKERLGEAPPTLGVVRRLGATALFVSCPPPCKRRSRIEIAALHMLDEMLYDEIAIQRRLICSECDRRAGPAAISIDWDVTASKPMDRR